MSTGSRRERFWEAVCSLDILGPDLIFINLVLLVLVLFPLAVLQEGTASKAIAKATFLILLFNMFLGVVVFWNCRRIAR